jgi:hypothetical protein
VQLKVARPVSRPIHKVAGQRQLLTTFKARCRTATTPYTNLTERVKLAPLKFNLHANRLAALRINLKFHASKLNFSFAWVFDQPLVRGGVSTALMVIHALVRDVCERV